MYAVINLIYFNSLIINFVIFSLIIYLKTPSISFISFLNNSNRFLKSSIYFNSKYDSILAITYFLVLFFI